MSNRLIIDYKNKTFILVGHFYGRIENTYLYISDSKSQDQISLNDIEEYKDFNHKFGVEATRILYKRPGAYHNIEVKRYIICKYLPDIIFPTKYFRTKFIKFLNEI